LAASVQLLICVEGPNDISFLKNLSSIIRQINPLLPDLSSDPRVAIFPLGGGTLKDWVNNNYLAGLLKPEFHIYDRDEQVNPPYQAAANAVIARGEANYAILTTKRECENYIHNDAINRVLGIALPVCNDFDDIPELVAERLHILNGGLVAWADLDSDQKAKKRNRAKKKLNCDVVPQMTVAELQIIDANNEIVSWFQEILNRLN
jgi:hypothetical protein